MERFMQSIVRQGALALILARSLVHQIRVDTAQTSTQRMEKLWIVTYLNEDGIETIAQTKSPTGETCL
jgi:hypothetical protein